MENHGISCKMPKFMANDNKIMASNISANSLFLCRPNNSQIPTVGNILMLLKKFESSDLDPITSKILQHNLLTPVPRPYTPSKKTRE